jgi:plasmid stabilization system protein ParE
VERLEVFPHSGREVPEFARPDLREIVMPPYRMVYRVVSETSVHVVTVHHPARLLRE